MSNKRVPSRFRGETQRDDQLPDQVRTLHAKRLRQGERGVHVATVAALHLSTYMQMIAHGVNNEKSMQRFQYRRDDVF